MTSRPWLRYEREIIADLFDRIRRWDADGRKPPQTYFTAGLEREVAQMIQRAIDEAVREADERAAASSRAQAAEAREAELLTVAMSVRDFFRSYDKDHNELGLLYEIFISFADEIDAALATPFPVAAALVELERAADRLLVERHPPGILQALDSLKGAKAALDWARGGR